MGDGQGVVCPRARLDGGAAWRTSQAEISADASKIHNLRAALSVVTDGETTAASTGSGRRECDVDCATGVAAKVAGQLLVCESRR